MKNRYLVAKEIVLALRKSGFNAYFAGGFVRDKLMGLAAEDIDIATDADPSSVAALFPKTIKVGMHFGVVVVVKEGYHFEVSTFRQDIRYEDGRRPAEIALSNEVEDAKRRDFTINGMFYDPIEEKIIDYVGGEEDIKNRLIRTIGNPLERFEEDRLRMIRAVRFAFRFGFQLEKQTEEAISRRSSFLFPSVAIERVWQELKKMADNKGFDQAMVKLFALGLLQTMFPLLSSASLRDIEERVSTFSSFPRSCPAIFYVMELFSSEPSQVKLDICDYLKISNKDRRLVEYTLHLQRHLLQEPPVEDHELVLLYAHPFFETAVNVIAAKLEESERANFIRKHREHQRALAFYIEKERSKEPLLSSCDLKNEGIQPGKRMGQLLEEGRRLAINRRLSSQREILEHLRQSSLWLKEHENNYKPQ